MGQFHPCLRIITCTLLSTWNELLDHLSIPRKLHSLLGLRLNVISSDFFWQWLNSLERTIIFPYQPVMKLKKSVMKIVKFEESNLVTLIKMCWCLLFLFGIRGCCEQTEIFLSSFLFNEDIQKLVKNENKDNKSWTYRSPRSDMMVQSI